MPRSIPTAEPAAGPVIGPSAEDAGRGLAPGVGASCSCSLDDRAEELVEPVVGPGVVRRIGIGRTARLGMCCGPAPWSDSRQLGTSHRRTVRSRLPERSWRSPGVKTTRVTAWECPLNRAISKPVFTSQRRIVGSSVPPPETMVLPSDENSALLTRPSCFSNRRISTPSGHVPEAKSPVAAPEDQEPAATRQVQRGQTGVAQDRTDLPALSRCRKVALDNPVAPSHVDAIIVRA